MTDFRTPPAHEPGPQPDPMLEPGRRSSGWIWLFGIAILAIVVGTLYGINNQESQTASKEPAPAQVSGSNAAPQSGGETTGAAPKDQQSNQQNGNGGGQKSGGSNQAAPANSPNAAAPQKDQSGQTNQQPQKQQ
jgi:hypothetical protein